MFRDEYGLKDWVAGAIVLLVVLAFIISFVLLMVFLDRLECQQFAAGMMIPWKYDVLGGCFLQVRDGSWVHEDLLRYNQLVQ